MEASAWGRGGHDGRGVTRGNVRGRHDSYEEVISNFNPSQPPPRCNGDQQPSNTRCPFQMQWDPITGELATPDVVCELQYTRKCKEGEILWLDPQSQDIPVIIFQVYKFCLLMKS